MAVDEAIAAPSTAKPVCFFVPDNIFTSMVDDADSSIQQAGGKALSVTQQVASTYEDPHEEQIRIPKSSIPLNDSVPVSKQRHIFDLQFCKEPRNFPGTLSRSEGEPALNRNGDPSVDQCYDNIGIVRDFYSQVFGNDAILGEGIPLVGVVHYDFYFPNAWWHPLETDDAGDAFPAIIFGDGWDNDPWTQGTPIASYGGCFGNFTGSLDIVAHELTHGMVHTKKKLDTRGISGAVNEHIADVFAIMCEQWHKKQSFSQADWLIGEDLVCKEWKGISLRSMKEPGTAYTLKEKHARIGNDCQVSHMKDLYDGLEDGGGVHINSGILNRAFYLVCKALNGNSWDAPGKIWYDAITDGKLSSPPDFVNWALVTGSVAKKTFGRGSPEHVAVESAWKTVGVM